MPKIDQAAIAELEVPVPPEPELQAATVARVREATAARDRLFAACNQAQRRSTNLRRALLSAAFSGRLTGRSTDKEVVEELAGV